MESNPDQQRLISEVKDWCTTIKQLVIDSGKKLVEEVKLSPNPEKLKFIKNEDIRTLVNQGKVGFLTAVPAPPDVSPSNSQFRKKEGLTTIKEDEDEESGEFPSWTVGSVVIAKWSEDSVWYNAKIEKVLADGSYEVLFVDYGNSDKVKPAEIVSNVNDIMEGEDLDECVDQGPCQDPGGVTAPAPEKKFTVGQILVARWSEDNVWYRAKILEVTGQGSIQVVFTDYGNEAKVEEKNIVLCGADIPAEEEDFVDEFVEGFKSSAEAAKDQKAPEEKKEEAVKKVENQGVKPEEAKEPSKENQPGDQIKEAPGEILTVSPTGDTLPPQFAVGDLVVARWSTVDEDGVDGDDVWYNGRVEGVSEQGYRVLFVDYGNFSLVERKNLVKTPHDIPKGDLIDELVENTVQEAKKEKEAVAAEPAVTPAAGGDFSVDTECFAKWTEDEVWYNAKVEKVLQDGTFQVLFLDYGNSEVAPRSNILLNWAEIPKGDEIDENVIEPSTNTLSKDIGTSEPPPAETTRVVNISSEPPREIPEVCKKLEKPELVAGQICLAKWDDDEVWYRAKVTKTSGPKVEVVFSDYGNSAILVRERIVLRYQDIPAKDVAEEMIDDNVIEYSTNEDVTSKNPPAETSNISSEPPKEIPQVCKKLKKPELVAGQICLAKWDDDEVWYRAKVTKTSEANVEVVFSDYGNSAILVRERIVLSYRDIPAKDVAEEMIDENVEVKLEVESAVKAGKSVVVEGKKEIVVLPTTPSPSPPEVVSEKAVKAVAERSFKWSVGDKCVARWGEDQVWYRGVIAALGEDNTSASVTFVDYGNEDRVILQDILASGSQIPPGQEDFIDENVEFEPVVSAGKSSVVEKKEVEKDVSSEPSLSLSGSLNTTSSSGIGDSISDSTFFNFIERNVKGDFTGLSIKKKLVFNVKSPAGVSVLANGSVAIVSRLSDCVKIFSRTGSPLSCPLEGHREFEKPTNILRLSNGKIVVRDTKGLQLFTQQGKFVRQLGEAFQNCYYGLAEDDQGNVLTINHRDASKPSGAGTVTTSGRTDVLGFNQEGNLVSKMELEDLIEREDQQLRSKCRHLGFSKGRLYIVDSGLHQVFVTAKEEATVFGEAGDKACEFNMPAEIAFDDLGNSIIVDTRNNRLQLVDANQNAYPVKVDHQLVKPVGIHYDKDHCELYVSNIGENTVVCFQLS